MLKKLLLIILSTGFLSACNSNAGSTTKLTNQKQLSAQSAASGKIEAVDLFTLNFSSDPVTQPSLQAGTLSTNGCSQDNEVCVTHSNLPEAIFASSGSSGKHWLQRDFPFKLYVKFNKNVSKDFHLAKINNDVPTGGINSIGHISQIDTSDCDNSLKNSGSECSIVLMYSGDNISSNSDLQNPNSSAKCKSQYFSLFSRN